MKKYVAMPTYPSVIFSIKLLSTGEEHCPSRHVEPHCEGFRCEERLDEPLTKQDLCCLFEDGQETPVMDPYSSLQER